IELEHGLDETARAVEKSAERATAGAQIEVPTCRQCQPGQSPAAVHSRTASEWRITDAIPGQLESDLLDFGCGPRPAPRRRAACAIHGQGLDCRPVEKPADILTRI